MQEKFMTSKKIDGRWELAHSPMTSVWKVDTNNYCMNYSRTLISSLVMCRYGLRHGM